MTLHSFFSFSNLRSFAFICGLLFSFLLCAPAFAGQTVRYVDKDNASGNEDGLSWATAYTTIQPAIDAAYDAGGGEVWVAEGAYNEHREFVVANPPNRIPTNTGAIHILEGITVCGGFEGNESDSHERDWVTHLTTIDGSTSRNGSRAYLVVQGENGCALDGFRVTGGMANQFSLGLTGPGGVLFKNVVARLSNCTVEGNTGLAAGGASIVGAGCIIENCHFINNVATEYNAGGLNTRDAIIRDCYFEGNTSTKGGAISGSDFTVERCVFVNNQATGSNAKGGAIYGEGDVHISNSLFVGNKVGAVYLVGRWENDFPVSIASIINCTFAENYGTALHLIFAPYRVRNTIFYGKNGSTVSPPTISDYADNIILQDSTNPEQDQDPLYVAPALGNYRLRPASPGIDSGLAEDGPLMDLEGAPRPLGAAHDMGAYEFDPDAPFVDPYDPNGDSNINALDIQEVINATLGLGTTAITDINSDGATNALDIQFIINAALGMY